MHGTHLEDLTTRIKPRTASNLLLWFVVAFIVAFFLWAGFTKLDRTVRGQGRVIPSAHLQVVSNLEGGVVQEILVHAGQEVHAGDVLIRLDPTASGSELGSGQATVTSLQVKIARLEAEIQDREPVYPADRAIRRSPTRSGSSRRCTPRGSPTSPASSAPARRGSARPSAASPRPRPPTARGPAPISSASPRRGSSGRWSSAASSRGSASSRPRARPTSRAATWRARRETVARARAGVAEARSTLAQAHQEWRAQAGDRARHRPGRARRPLARPAGARQPHGAHRAARAAVRPDQPRPRHHASAAPSMPASRWSRSCRRATAC